MTSPEQERKSLTSVALSEEEIMHTIMTHQERCEKSDHSGYCYEMDIAGRATAKAIVFVIDWLIMHRRHDNIFGDARNYHFMVVGELLNHLADMGVVLYDRKTREKHE